MVVLHTVVCKRLFFLLPATEISKDPPLLASDWVKGNG